MKLGVYGKVSCQSPWTIEESSSSISCGQSDERGAARLSLDLLFALPEGLEDCVGAALWVTFALPAACETVSLSFSANSRFVEVYDQQSVYLKTFRGTASATAADLFEHRLDASLRGAFTLKLVSVKPAGCRVCFFAGMELDILLQAPPPPAGPAAVPVPLLAAASLPAPHQGGVLPTASPLTAPPPPPPPPAGDFADGPRQWLALDFSHAALSRLLDSKLGPLHSRLDNLERSVSSLALLAQQQLAQQQHLLLLHHQNLQLQQQLQQLLVKQREDERKKKEEEEEGPKHSMVQGGVDEVEEEVVQEVVGHMVDILSTEEKKKDEVLADVDGGDSVDSDGGGGGGGGSEAVETAQSN
eukprot:gene1413-1537_t